MKRKSLSIGIQTFSQLVDGNYVYADKTELIYKLLTQQKEGFYFLSRPRRFGKTLLITTLFEIFKGNRELFKGYFIYDKWGFDEYPVIHIDFNKIVMKNIELSGAIFDYIKDYSEKKYGISLEKTNYSSVFSELIEKLKERYKKDVVVLIDEYDKAIVNYLEEMELAKEHRDILKSFYSNLKAYSGDIKFCLLTGVSKFSKVSVFSDLNHLKDLTLMDQYSTICGYTKEEIEINYSDYLDDFAKSENITKEELLEEI
ncbi:AAA family ATPase, partial [bacterium]|nr:AAA family ATPase [bacterium]